MPFLRQSLPDLVSIACYHCGRRQDVGRKAMTVTCRHCHKPLQIGDVHVKRYDARREVRTVGLITVEKRGSVVADRVECGGLVARGEVKSKRPAVVRGTASLGPKSKVTGGVEAWAVVIADGATIDGDFCVGKGHMVAPKPAVEGAEGEAPPAPEHADAPPAAPTPRPDVGALVSY